MSPPSLIPYIHHGYNVIIFLKKNSSHVNNNTTEKHENEKMRYNVALIEQDNNTEVHNMYDLRTEIPNNLKLDILSPHGRQ